MSEIDWTRSIDFDQFEPDDVDVDGILQRTRERQSSDRDSALFDVAMLMRFNDQVYTDKPVDTWILRALASAFSNVLAGGDWADEIRLPWMPPNPLHPRVEGRGLNIYCFVESATQADSNLGVVAALHQAAERFHCSYETARADYYQWRARISESQPSKSE